MLCAAVGTSLVLLGVIGVSDTFDAVALICASVAFAAAAIFMIVSIVLRHRARLYSSTYQPLSRNDEAEDA